MGGFFGTISKVDCVNDLFYGTDYNSHLGTKRAGMVTFDKEKGFSRSIENIPLKSLFLGHKQLGLSYFLALCRYSICEKSENHDELKKEK